jgi:N-formylglutamate deformylase
MTDFTGVNEALVRMLAGTNDPDVLEKTANAIRESQKIMEGVNAGDKARLPPELCKRVNRHALAAGPVFYNACSQARELAANKARIWTAHFCFVKGREPDDDELLRLFIAAVGLSCHFRSWAVLHVPHDSTDIPESIRDQFVLGPEDLRKELVKMTDHKTHELFAWEVYPEQVVRSPVSRLVVDVERFERDEEEPMAARGMGAIYDATHDLRPLRRPLRPGERASLLERWYRPHHQALSLAVDLALGKYGCALVIDAHSFPSSPLPYELDQTGPRPQICIGSDEFHTPPTLVGELVRAFEEAGLSTAVNSPFSGALVPRERYRQDPRVLAVMIEVRRDLYLDEATGEPNAGFESIKLLLRKSLVAAMYLQRR